VTYNHEETEVVKNYKGERKCMVCGRFPIIVSSKTSGICDCELREYNAMSDGSRQVLDFLMGRKKRTTVEGIVNRIRDNGLEQLFFESLLPNLLNGEKEFTEQEDSKLRELQEEINALLFELQIMDSHSIDKKALDRKALNRQLTQLYEKRKKQKQLRKVQLEKNRRIAIEKQWPTSLLLEKVEAIVENLHSHPFPLVEKSIRRKKKQAKEALKLTELGRLLQEWKLKEKRSELLNKT